MFEMTKNQYERWSGIRKNGMLQYALLHNLALSILLGVVAGIIWSGNGINFRAYLSYWYIFVILFELLFLYVVGVAFALFNWWFNERNFKRYESKT